MGEMIGSKDDSDDDPINFDEDVERSWRLYNKAFIDDVYPMFKEIGLSIGEAFMIWEFNRLKNAINRMLDDDS